MNDDQRHENFLCLKMHIHLLENFPLTEDRLDAYKRFYRMIRGNFPDMEIVNLENQERRFRSATREAELCMRSLDREFNANVYCTLLRLIVFIVDDLTDYDDLTRMMESFGL
jgi:hypothetical protein